MKTVLPRDFVNHFGHLRAAEVIYEGNFNSQFVQDVKDGKYPVEEGVVAKGVKEGKKQHGLWMSKVKTRKWFERLKHCATERLELRSILDDTVREQEYA